MADLLALPRPAKSLQNGAGLSEKLEHTGPAEKERVASVLKVSNWQVRQSRLCQKEREPSRLFRAPNREMGESQSKQEPHLGQRKGDQSESMEEKSKLHGKRKQVTRR